MQNNIKEDISRVPQTINFSAEEKNVLEYWSREKVFENCLKQSQNKPRYTFYDGPPFATGIPHYGHILAGTIKDVITRYSHQKGYHVPRRFGWDCHGLPVEYEIDKTLGIRGPEDVNKMGIASYNEECRKIVMRYSNEWEEVVNRMGRWIDFRNDYKTMYPWYMESVWWVFKQLYEKGLIYQGVKVMPYSTACTTPLSNFESGQNYKIVVDPSIIVSVPIIIDSKDTVNFLIWTTTPWTLPSNLAICVNSKIIYAKVLDLESKKIVILAKCRIETIFKNPSKYHVIETFIGESLKNWRYKPIFKYFEDYGNRMNAFRVLLDGYVDCNTGTGVVHQAPYFGEDDYRVCLRERIIDRDSKIICPVDDSGRFTEIVTDFAGQYIKDADKNIIIYLKEHGYLFQEGQIKHSYPFCWRSDTPLIYKAIPAWFIRVEHMSRNLLQCNGQTNWVPDFVKTKRFGNWLKDARDWAVSRNRYWGTPIPIWVSSTGDEIVCVSSIDELAKLSGKTVQDLHRESVDHIEIPSQIPDNSPLRRIPEVFDCWFESGSMPFAQHHYPFENKDKFHNVFPADFIAEGIDQTRGWFYTLLVISTALYNKSPYKNVIVNGLVLASDGQKMSKRKKNYPDPLEIMNKYGADALRLYLINSPVVRGENLRFEETGVKDIIKTVLLPWYNSFRMLIQNIVRLEKEDNLKYSYNQERHKAEFEMSSSIMDIWIVSLKESLLDFVYKEMKEYRLYTVVPKLISFLNQLTKWYIRLNRKRIKGEIDQEQCIQSIDTLFDVLVTMVKVMAPFTPFLSEYLYQRFQHFLVSNEKNKNYCSIHYKMLPDLNRNYIRYNIEIAVSRMQSVIELGRIIRDRRNISLKFPIKKIIVVHTDQSYLNDILSLQDLILKELNVRKLTTSTDRKKYGVVLKAEPNYEKLGARLGKNFKEITKLIKMLNDDTIERSLFQKYFQISGLKFNIDEIQVKYCINQDLLHQSRFEFNTDSNVVVFMDMTQTEELTEEGYAREIINRIQKLKKQAVLVPTDNVYIFYKFINEKNSKLKQIAEKYKGLIETTIKSPFLELLLDHKKPCLLEQLIDINDEVMKISISKEDHRFPISPWINVILADDRLEVRYLRNKSNTGCLLIQNPNGEYLTIDYLKHEIEALFGLYDCNFILLFNNGLPLLNVNFDICGKTIFVTKSLSRGCEKFIDKSFIYPFCNFLNCQFNNKNFTLFLENPKYNEFYKSDAIHFEEVFKQMFPDG